MMFPHQNNGFLPRWWVPDLENFERSAEQNERKQLVYDGKRKPSWYDQRGNGPRAWEVIPVNEHLRAAIRSIHQRVDNIVKQEQLVSQLRTSCLPASNQKNKGLHFLVAVSHTFWRHECFCPSSQLVLSEQLLTLQCCRNRSYGISGSSPKYGKRCLNTKSKEMRISPMLQPMSQNSYLAN